MREEGTLSVLCDAAAVAADVPALAELAGVRYAVFRIDGRYYVTHDHCTHGPGSLSEGMVEGEEVECPFHQGRFHIPTGRPTAPPCTEAVRVFTAHLIDGRICIDPREAR
jgi:nitrite reductase/ring-hydroxylating ferredoxin subunit